MNDGLERLRAANPVGADPGAPPIETVLARIATDEAVPAERPRRRWSPSAIAPVLGAFAVAAVVVGVVLVIHVRSQPASAPAALTGGMRGSITPDASGLDADSGWVWFSRCIGRCDGFSERRSSWLATTSDGGDTWQVARRGRLQIPPVSGSGQDKWAGSVGDNGGGGVVASDTGGDSWRAIHVPRSPNVYSVSVAGGEVWAASSGCSGACAGVILRGPVSGSHLSATMAVPRHAAGAVQLIAVSAASAYLHITFGDGHSKAWVTENGGRSWQPAAAGCTSQTLDGSGTGAIWRSCLPDGHPVLGISTDGGRHWVYRPNAFSTSVLYPASARIAWAQTYAGATMRTTDGGRSWQTVLGPLSNDQARHEPLSVELARNAALSVQSATAATETIPVTHLQHGVKRTNLMVYRTADGGNHWLRTPVPLPSR